VLKDAIEHQPPPRTKGAIRPKLRYAHQGGKNPPIIVIHGNGLDHISQDYRRYLERHFRDAFSLTGTPLRIEFRTGKNPFDPEKGK
jgi:GTP-binding protein